MERLSQLRDKVERKVSKGASSSTWVTMVLLRKVASLPQASKQLLNNLLRHQDKLRKY